jgi:5,10-methenyltetrahydrofolate synthetase
LHVTDKETVRQNFIEMRRKHASHKRAADHAMGVRLQAFLAEFSGPVLAFRPLASEADPFGDTVNPNWCYPCVQGSDMVACTVQSAQDFQTSAFGVLEPKPECAVVESREFQIILIPGLAFDRLGNRIGFGKGYYDQFLKTTNPDATRVGICYSFQVSPTGWTCDEWDERLDWLVTERYLLHADRARGQGKD